MYKFILNNEELRLLISNNEVSISNKWVNYKDEKEFLYINHQNPFKYIEHKLDITDKYNEFHKKTRYNILSNYGKIYDNIIYLTTRTDLEKNGMNNRSISYYFIKQNKQNKQNLQKDDIFNVNNIEERFNARNQYLLDYSINISNKIFKTDCSIKKIIYKINEPQGNYKIDLQYFLTTGRNMFDNRFANFSPDQNYRDKSKQEIYAMKTTGQINKLWESSIKIGKSTDLYSAQQHFNWDTLVYDPDVVDLYETTQYQMTWQNNIKLNKGSLVVLYDFLQEEI